MPRNTSVIELRPYQREALCALWGYFQEQSGSPIVVLPTAAGKSVVIAEWCRGVLAEYPDSGILVLSHVAELLTQNMAELIGLWPKAPVGLYSASLGRRDIRAQIMFAGIASIHSHAYAIPRRIDFILIDECHLVGNKAGGMYRRFLDAMLTINPYLKVIGFSATPYRLGSGLLTEGDDAIFTDIAYEASVLPLIKNGYLAPLVTTPTETSFDLAGVATSGGEYVQGQLERAVDVNATTQAAVREIVKHGATRRSWLLFCSGVAHAKHVAEAVRTHGVSCASITGETDKGKRARFLADFKAGRLRCLTNNNVLTTGINVRGIDLLGFLRPTKSAALYVQMCGRGMRLSPETGKSECLVLDFAGNVDLFGPIDQIKVKPKGKGGEAPTKECPECEARVFASARECPNCGYPFPILPNLEEKLSANASKSAILSTGLPPPGEWLEVKDVTYKRHEKPGKPPSLRVDYHVGLTRHSAWWCPEHIGFARQKFVQAWIRHAPGLPVPSTVDDALASAHALAKPTKILVRMAGKYPEILGTSFV